MPIFTACLVPSRPGIPEYARYAAQVVDYEQRLNARYPGCMRLFVEQNRARAFAALRMYDVLCVNSLAEGMNLVAFEGALLNDHAGVLVLSDRTGSSEYLGKQAILISDPHNIAATASALRRALDMPLGERARRATALRLVASQGSPASWLEDQLGDLDRVAAGHRPVAVWPLS
jgi:trehalose 6-phosphate synthase